mgnify:FL=1
MHYEFNITVPANTTERAPVTRELHVSNGLIYDGAVQFPIGCFGLARCRLEHHSFGSLPTNRESYYSSDGYLVPIGAPIMLDAEPYIIRATCWNEDDTYQHVVTIRFEMASGKLVLGFMSLVAGLQKFLKMVGVKV